MAEILVSDLCDDRPALLAGVCICAAERTRAAVLADPILTAAYAKKRKSRFPVDCL
jgi:hypothetical protein